MKKILIALLTVPLLMAPMLSFSVQAEDTPPVNTSNSDNSPNGNKGCQTIGVPCSVYK